MAASWHQKRPTPAEIAALVPLREGRQESRPEAGGRLIDPRAELSRIIDQESRYRRFVSRIGEAVRRAGGFRGHAILGQRGSSYLWVVMFSFSPLPGPPSITVFIELPGRPGGQPARAGVCVDDVADEVGAYDGSVLSEVGRAVRTIKAGLRA